MTKLGHMLGQLSKPKSICLGGKVLFLAHLRLVESLLLKYIEVLIYYHIDYLDSLIPQLSVADYVRVNIQCCLFVYYISLILVTEFGHCNTNPFSCHIPRSLQG